MGATDAMEDEGGADDLNLVVFEVEGRVGVA